MMETIRRDLSSAARVLRMNRGFSAVVILVFALGIGASTAIYSVVHALILSPLPYRSSERLVMLQASHRPDPMGIEVSAANFLDWRGESRSFASLGAYAPRAVNLTSEEIPERLRAVRITPGGLAALGVEPILGRLFLPEEEDPDVRIALLSHGLWRSRFGADEEIVGRMIELGDLGYQVVGVMPPSFAFPDRESRIWLPLSLRNWSSNRQSRWLYVFGRLRDGVSIDAAQREMDSITEGLSREFPGDNAGWGARTLPLREHVVGHVRPALLILLITVALVLLTACASVINLQLARAAGRRTEMAIRSALGASRSAVLRQLLVEGLVLASLGGALGLLLAQAGVRLLVAWSPAAFPRLEEVALDGNVLSAVLAMSVLTGIICGFGTGLPILKPNLVRDLREGAATVSGAGKALTVRRLLTVGEVMAAVVLTIGALLLVTSLSRLLDVDPGFDPARVLTSEVVVPWDRYPEEADRAAFFRRLVEEARLLPGVEAAGGVSTLPLSGSNATLSYAVEGERTAGSTGLPEAGFQGVTPGYFRALGISLLEGRDFSLRDDREAPKVAIVNRTFANRNWPGEIPIGKRLFLSGSTRAGGWHEVIGVIGDIHHTRLDRPVVPEIYVTYDQMTPWDNTYLVIRTRGSGTVSIGQLRALVRDIDPKQPISNVRTMEAVLAESVSDARLYSILLSGFAGLAFILATAGIYSIISYSVSQRRHEIAIRMALGAQRGHVIGLVLREGMGLAALGILAGLAGSWMATRGLAHLLYRVEPADPLIYLASAAILGGIGALASLVPALRASRLLPTACLRSH